MPARCSIDPNNRGGCCTVPLDQFMAKLAGHQHGVVSRAQLLEAGFPRHLVDRRVATSRLHVVHQGVYSVGHRAAAPDGHRMAAVLAAGKGAVLSHRGAAGLWMLRPGVFLEVTAPSFRRRPGIRIRRPAIAPDEITTVRGIPVTTVARTLFDLAALLRPHQLERVINEADVQGHTGALSLPDLIARYPGRKGIPAINAILGTEPAFTRQELEARFRRFVRHAGIQPPLFNAAVAGYECDCVWPDHGLIVELDGRATHGTRAAFEWDRERDRILQASRWRVVRVTWRQLHDRPEAIAADLRSMLAAGTPRRGPARAAGP
jgi:very-short-patch-repair endonuclease